MEGCCAKEEITEIYYSDLELVKFYGVLVGVDAFGFYFYGFLLPGLL
jgi:hypothetical protein